MWYWWFSLAGQWCGQLFGNSVSCWKSFFYTTHKHMSAQLQQCLQYIKHSVVHGRNLLLILIMCHTVSKKERKDKERTHCSISTFRFFIIRFNEMYRVVLLLELSQRTVKIMVKALTMDFTNAKKCFFIPYVTYCLMGKFSAILSKHLQMQKQSQPHVLLMQNSST